MTLQQLKEQEIAKLNKFLLSDCRCDDGYKDRDLVDPACPWHFVYESGLLVSVMEKHDLRLEQAIIEELKKKIEGKIIKSEMMNYGDYDDNVTWNRAVKEILSELNHQ